jgi:hypothetical protein
VTNYYIIPVINIEKEPYPSEDSIKPMTLEEFTQKRKVLNIPDSLKFTTELKDLE